MVTAMAPTPLWLADNVCCTLWRAWPVTYLYRMFHRQSREVYTLSGTVVALVATQIYLVLCSQQF